MSNLIAKGLRGGHVRFAICVAGIAVSTMLILVLFAVYRSVESGITTYLGQPGLDLWVAPRGTDNLIRSSGLITSDTLGEIRRLPNVVRADPILRAFVTVEAKGERVTLLAIGFRAPHGLGGPTFISGLAPASSDEIVIDRAAAHLLHVRVGDTVSLNRQTKRIVGISRETNLLATQFVFGDLASMSDPVPLVSFIVVEVAKKARPLDVLRDIHRDRHDLDIFTSEEFLRNNLREVGAGFRPMLLLITILGTTSAALLVAFLIEGVVEERRGELAVLLATGMTPAAIAGGLTLHAARLLVAGIAAGTACAHLLSWGLDLAAPVVPLTYSSGDLLIVASMLSAAGVIASVVPLLRLKDIDPLEAFRS